MVKFYLETSSPAREENNKKIAEEMKKQEYNVRWNFFLEKVNEHNWYNTIKIHILHGDKTSYSLMIRRTDQGYRLTVEETNGTETPLCHKSVVFEPTVKEFIAALGQLNPITIYLEQIKTTIDFSEKLRLLLDNADKIYKLRPQLSEHDLIRNPSAI